MVHYSVVYLSMYKKNNLEGSSNLFLLFPFLPVKCQCLCLLSAPTVIHKTPTLELTIANTLLSTLPADQAEKSLYGLEYDHVQCMLCHWPRHFQPGYTTTQYLHSKPRPLIRSLDPSMPLLTSALRGSLLSFCPDVPRPMQKGRQNSKLSS